MQKYGFIYIWYDRKNKKFYLGRHWGNVDDGYICSSKTMRNNYSYRKHDFKRRVISYVYTSKQDLVVEEQRWLDKIKPEECGVRYYNKTLKSSTPSTRGYNHSDETKEKMRIAALGRTISEETKEKIRQANLGKKYSDETNKKKGINDRDYSDPQFLIKMSLAAQNRSDETIKKISENSKKLQAEGIIGMRGKKHSPESIEKMRQSALNRNINKKENLKGEHTNAI